MRTLVVIWIGFLVFSMSLTVNADQALQFYNYSNYNVYIYGNSANEYQTIKSSKQAVTCNKKFGLCSLSNDTPAIALSPQPTFREAECVAELPVGDSKLVYGKDILICFKGCREGELDYHVVKRSAKSVGLSDQCLCEDIGCPSNQSLLQN